jgi:hypothetical protein
MSEEGQKLRAVPIIKDDVLVGIAPTREVMTTQRIQDATDVPWVGILPLTKYNFKT